MMMGGYSDERAHTAMFFSKFTFAFCYLFYIHTRDGVEIRRRTVENWDNLAVEMMQLCNLQRLSLSENQFASCARDCWNRFNFSIMYMFIHLQTK